MLSSSSLVLITALSLLRGCACSALPSGGSSSPTVPPVRPRGFLDTTEDYDNFSDEPLAGVTPTIPTGGGGGGGGGAAHLCDYDVCRENQTPCSQLAAATGCFCPGVSSYHDPPEPPVLKSVTSEGGGDEVTVRWCAPYSPVDSYLLTVGGSDRGAEFGKERRSGTLQLGPPSDRQEATRVCVVALNDRGRSAEGAESCAMYRPGDDGDGSASSWLRAGLIGGALGLLLLLSLGLLLWRHRTKRRKAQARISS